MSDQVIGIDEYGSFAKNVKNEDVCHKCKYFNYHNHAEPCKSCLEVYYYPNNLEAAKLEAELTPETFTINDMYVTSKQLFDCQDELKDLQIENDQLKERIGSINEYLDNRISDSDFVIKNRKRDNLEYENIMEYKQCYQNVKEFIKNQK